MTKPITIEQLQKLCDKQTKAGNGKKAVVISSDDEGNEFHPLYFGFTPKEEIFTGSKYEPWLRDLKKDDDFIILG